LDALVSPRMAGADDSQAERRAYALCTRLDVTWLAAGATLARQGMGKPS
jgi:hypothetical protein